MRGRFRESQRFEPKQEGDTHFEQSHVNGSEEAVKIWDS